MSTRPPPPGAPRFGFNRVYRSNLRPVIIAVGSLSALWSLLSAIGLFRSVNIDKQEGVPKLATFAIVLGAVYSAVSVIEIFGVVAAVSQRLALVRTYAYLSLAVIVLTTGGGLFQVVTHFTSKSDILKECTDLTSGTFAVYPFGFFGPSRHETIDAEDAAAWCRSQYDRNSWQDIVGLLIYIFLTVSFSMLAWGYYRQVLDPTSVVNSIRAPSHQYNAYPMPQYGQPYNASVPNLGYGYPAPPQQQYAPPPGAPPASRDMGAPKPGYGADDDKENPFADFDERAAPAPART